MKTLAFVLIILSTSAFAKDVAVSCGNHTAHVYLGGSDFAISGNIHHLYTSANIICARDTKYRIQGKQPFKCAGLWDHDLDRSGNPFDSIAEVNFEFKEEKLVANLKTSRFHGRKIIELECEIQ